MFDRKGLKYTGSDSKIELWQGVAMHLSQGFARGAKQLNLNKLSDAAGPQMHWLTTQLRNDFLIKSGRILNSFC